MPLKSNPTYAAWLAANDRARVIVQVDYDTASRFKQASLLTGRALSHLAAEAFRAKLIEIERQLGHAILPTEPLPRLPHGPREQKPQPD